MKYRSALLTAVIVFIFSTSISANEQWVTVRSKNFHLIGNADEIDIRSVATKLEQFRQVFGFLFPKIKLTETVETKVIVFKDRETFRPFLPKRQDGTPDDGIGGYFLTSESANYIALSTGVGKQTTFETIFHEYVHYLLNNNFRRSEIPPWLNEGLAEYYSTVEIENGNKVYLGNVRRDHLYFLKRNTFIPLKSFFEVDNFSLHQNGDHTRTAFYAQAWALVHYLSNNKKLDNLDVFLKATASDEDPEKAFKKAFGLDYTSMEPALRAYVKQQKFTRLIATLEQKLQNNDVLSVSNLSQADVYADLGSLLYHRGDLADAEDYLGRSLALNKEQAIANTSMGLLKLQQDKFTEARSYLEKAVSNDEKDYYVYYSHAYVLSRMGMDDTGYVLGYKPELAKTMRRSIMKAIELKPAFVPSYNLLAFVNLATNENLEESVGYLRKVLTLQPGNETASLTMAQIFLRQNKLDLAESLAKTVHRSTADKEQKATAQTILENVANSRSIEERNKKMMAGRGNGRPGSEEIAFVIVRNDLSDEEIMKIREERQISMMNKSVIKPGPGEKQIVGYVRSVECDGNAIGYSVEAVSGKVLRLRSQGFKGVQLRALTAEANNLLFNCGTRFKQILSVVNYRPGVRNAAGLVRAITFVPKIFRIKSKREIENDTRVMIIKNAPDDEGTAVEVKDPPENESPQALKKRRKQNQLARIAASLRKPRPGEKRSLGKITKIVCESKAMAFHLRTGAGTKVYSTSKPQGVETMVYGQDPSKIEIGCGIDPPAAPVVLTYRNSRSGGNSDGMIVYLEFVLEGVKIN